MPSIIYCAAMALSNAQRQKRFRERIRAKAETGVTPEMVVRAIRIVFERSQADCVSIGEVEISWEDFLARCRKNRSLWADMAPVGLAADDYWDDLSEEDIALLVKVSAVASALRGPPS